MEISKYLKEAMVALRLSGIIPTLADRIPYAKSKKLSLEEFLEMIFFDWKERRQARLLNSKMRKAGVDQDLKDYSWDTTTQYDIELVRKLFALIFVENHSSVLAYGPTGGKRQCSLSIWHLLHLRQDMLLALPGPTSFFPILGYHQLTAPLKGPYALT